MRGKAACLHSISRYSFNHSTQLNFTGPTGPFSLLWFVVCTVEGTGRLCLPRTSCWKLISKVFLVQKWLWINICRLGGGSADSALQHEHPADHGPGEALAGTSHHLHLAHPHLCAKILFHHCPFYLYVSISFSHLSFFVQIFCVDFRRDLSFHFLLHFPEIFLIDQNNGAESRWSQLLLSPRSGKRDLKKPKYISTVHN